MYRVVETPKMWQSACNAQNFADPVCGFPLHARQNVTVGLHRLCRRRVPKAFAHHLDVDAPDQGYSQGLGLGDTGGSGDFDECLEIIVIAARRPTPVKGELRSKLAPPPPHRCEVPPMENVCRGSCRRTEPEQ